MNEPAADTTPPAPLSQRQRRILGVLMEKARTTPDAYPLTLNGLVTGCNQKSNRHPLLDLTAEQVEDELEKMRAAGLVAEVQGSGRVPKYRHFGYDYMKVKGVEAAVMTELLLRGEQTAGELRTRASRFEAIADLQTLQNVLDALMARGLVIPLSPPGRGQLITHNLYQPEELARLQQAARQRPVADGDSPPTGASRGAGSELERGAPPVARHQDPPPQWQSQLEELRQEVELLKARVAQLES